MIRNPKIRKAIRALLLLIVIGAAAAAAKTSIDHGMPLTSTLAYTGSILFVGARATEAITGPRYLTLTCRTQDCPVHVDVATHIPQNVLDDLDLYIANHAHHTSTARNTAPPDLNRANTASTGA